MQRAGGAWAEPGADRKERRLGLRLRPCQARVRAQVRGRNVGRRALRARGRAGSACNGGSRRLFRVVGAGIASGWAFLARARVRSPGGRPSCLNARGGAPGSVLLQSKKLAHGPRTTALFARRSRLNVRMPALRPGSMPFQPARGRAFRGGCCGAKRDASRLVRARRRAKLGVPAMTPAFFAGKRGLRRVLPDPTPPKRGGRHSSATRPEGRCRHLRFARARSRS